MCSPTIDSDGLRITTDEDALAFADECLGPSSDWPSGLLQYRLSGDFQADWKAEVGQWLLRAKRLGFLDKVQKLVLARARSGTGSTGRDPNDNHHGIFHAEIAPAMVVHYLVGTGWRYSRWEPVTGSNSVGDVDLEMKTPDGVLANLQVKAPDLVDGEHDSRIIKAISKASKQLRPRGAQLNLIVVAPQRNWPVATTGIGFLVRHFVGSTTCNDSRVWLTQRDLGCFFTDSWNHVSAVVLIETSRAESFRYPCTVFANPRALVPISVDWFPHARVLSLEKNVFRWTRGEPGSGHTIPDGTVLED